MPRYTFIFIYLAKGFADLCEYINSLFLRSFGDFLALISSNSTSVLLLSLSGNLITHGLDLLSPSSSHLFASKQNPPLELDTCRQHKQLTLMRGNTKGFSSAQRK